MVRTHKKVIVRTELTVYGEVQFVVSTDKGIFVNKCLHDALSEANIKMTGIGPIVDNHRSKLKFNREFKIPIDEFRINRKDATSIG